MKPLAKFNWCLACLFLIVFLMAMGSSPVMAKVDCDKRPEHPTCPDDPNPDPPPPPDPDPEDPGSLCADSESDFPAFAYTVSTQLDNDPWLEYTEIFLSNAEGNCAIKIYGTDEDYWSLHLSYRYFPDDNTGRIVFTERKYIDDLFAHAPTQIRMLNFSIDEGAIVEDLPLSSTLLVQAPDVDGIADGSLSFLDLSPMGDRVVFVGSNNDDKPFIDEIKIDCASNPECRQRIFETKGVPLKSSLYSLDKERVYFTVDYPNRNVVFIEKESGNWPALKYDNPEYPRLSSVPTLILEGEGDYQHIKSIGLWDHDGSGIAQEVIAMPRHITSDLYSIEILDVEACLEADPQCVVPGVASASANVMDATLLPVSFTSYDVYPPALLLVKYVGRRNETGSILEVNLNDFDEQILINAIKDRKKIIHSMDSAD